MSSNNFFYVIFHAILLIIYVDVFRIQQRNLSPIYTGVAAVLLYFESNKLYELRAEARNLVAQMQHSQPEHALQQLRDQLHSQRQIGWNS